MQIKMINANGSVWVVKREFKGDSWFVEGLNKGVYSAQEICDAYCVEKVLKGNDGTHFLVNEVPEAQIVND